MKKLAVVGITARSSSAEEASKVFEEVDKRVTAWHTGKGKVKEKEESLSLIDLGEGRTAYLQDEITETAKGKSRKVVLREHLLKPQGQFQTTLHYATADGKTDVVCMLEAEGPTGSLVPVMPAAYLPSVMRDILNLPVVWEVGGAKISGKVAIMEGEDAGKALVRLIQDKERLLPVVVVSKFRNEQVVPRSAEAIAKDLPGLASVALIDDDVSWQMTHELGHKLSTYGGAIRIYWPLQGATDVSELRHHKWTRDTIMRLQKDKARGGIREAVRNLIFNISAYRPRFSSIIKDLEDSRRAEEQRKERKGADAEALCKLYFEENQVLKEQVLVLQTNVENLQAQLAYEKQTVAALSERLADVESSSLESGIPERFESVAQAVKVARERLAEELLFGGNVEDGVASVEADAGPPDKIFRSLEALADLAKALAAGTINSSVPKWLENRGVRCSSESETKKNNKNERQKRTWLAGSARRTFDLHVKVNENTSPGRCVRIYFDWDAQEGRIIVGWVGRHPD